MIGHFPNRNRNIFFLYRADSILKLGMIVILLAAGILVFGMVSVIGIISFMIHLISSVFGR